MLPLLKSHSRAGLPQKPEKPLKKQKKLALKKLATFSLKTRKNLHKFSKKLAKNRLCLFVRRCIFSYLSLFQFGLGIKDRKTKMKLKLTRYAIQGNSEFWKQNVLQIGFLMKNKYKMPIFSLQRHLLFFLIDCGTGFDFQRAFDHLFGNVNRHACCFFVFQPLLRLNKTREGDIMQWVSERGFYLI